MGLPAPVRGPSQAAVEVFGLDDDIVGYRRSPSDVVRLILFGLATVALLVLTRWAEGTVLAFESDVVALFGAPELFGRTRAQPDAVDRRRHHERGGVRAPAPPEALSADRLHRRRQRRDRAPRRCRDVVVGPGRAALADRHRSSIDSVRPSNGSLNLWTLAQLTSSFVILAPFVGRRWRQAGMVILATFVLGRIVLVSGLLRRDLPGRRHRCDRRASRCSSRSVAPTGARPWTPWRRRSRRAR